jgi:KUP system potassium uptake protein
MKAPSRHPKTDSAASLRHKAIDSSSHAPHGNFATLTIGALGIVYGDIGTSPLYAMDALFLGHAGSAQTPADVLGGVSLVIWTITLIVAIKYAILVLRAQNDGEGGVFALYGLLAERDKRGTTLLLWSLMLGAGLLFGDGIITPAISVLSAVEGLQVAMPALGNTVIPITIGLLGALFAIQFKGTSGIGIVFGPVLMTWFVVIAIIGAWQIKLHPDILAAFNPILGMEYLRRAGLFDALLILSALMLVVTGGEAMYADVGHFG